MGAASSVHIVRPSSTLLFERESGYFLGLSPRLSGLTGIALRAVGACLGYYIAARVAR